MHIKKQEQEGFLKDGDGFKVVTEYEKGVRLSS
jgi:hypothetical protein